MLTRKAESRREDPSGSEWLAPLLEDCVGLPGKSMGVFFCGSDAIPVQDPGSEETLSEASYEHPRIPVSAQERFPVAGRTTLTV